MKKSVFILIGLLLPVLVYGQGTLLNPNTWTALNPGGMHPLIVGYEKSDYCSTTGQVYWWGGYKHNSGENDNSLNSYSYAENRFFVDSTRMFWHGAHSNANGHSVAVFSCDPDDGIVAWQSDGSGSNQPEEMAGHFDWFDLTGWSGRDKTFSPRPWIGSGTPLGETLNYDTVDHKFLMLDANGALEACTPSTNSCAVITTSGATLPVAWTSDWPSFSFDTDNGTLYMYGGNQANTFTFKCSTTACTAGTITQLTTSCTGAACNATAPPTRSGAGFAYSHQDAFFLMMGGTSTPFSNVTAFSDTWTFNPSTNAWTQITVTGSPYTFFGNTSFSDLVHDDTDNVFLFLAEIVGGGVQNPQVWAFAPTGDTPLNYGRTSVTYTPTAGYINNATTGGGTSESLAFAPHLAVNGSSLYATWIESGADSDSTNNCTSDLHPYVSQFTGSAWTGLPAYSNTACLSLNPPASDAVTANAVLAVVNGVQWEAYDAYKDSLTTEETWAESWNGTAWTGGAVGCFSGTCSTSIPQAPVSLIGVGTKPTLAVIEWNRTTFVPGGFLYVPQYNGTSWAALGGVSLNINGAGSQVLEAQLATDGTNTFACWSEQVESARSTNSLTPQIYCKEFNGTAWSQLGASSLNQAASDWANDPSITYVRGNLYVAFEERTVSGNEQIFVKQWNGSAWSLVGSGAINQNTSTGWAVHPRLTNDGVNVYVAWEEQSALGSNSKGLLKVWNGVSWAWSGGAFNADTLKGSVNDTDIAWVPGTGKLYSAWGEEVKGNLQQIYSSQVGGPNGLGSSTLTCLDKDGDGYGVGSGCTGPDADDNDATVHTAAQAVAKYGSIQAFLEHRGYTWITQYWVISPTGNDTTCGTTAYTFAANPDPTAVQACATFAHVNASQSAGDVVFWRAGTYAVTDVLTAGTASAWTVYMGYPGEAVVMNCPTDCFDMRGLDSAGIQRSYFYIDGFKLVGNGGQTPVDGGTCFRIGNTSTDCYGTGATHTDADLLNHDVVIRNVEVSGGFWNISFFNAYNMTIEDSVLHDSTSEHNIYIGANVSLSHDYYIHRNLIYKGSTTGMQINGRVSNAVVEQNIAYSNSISGFSFEEGVNHSYFRNNLSFNNGQTGMIITNYDGNCFTSGFGTSTGFGGICPYDQNFNTVEGNTLWVGTTRADGTSFANYGFQLSNTSQTQTSDIGHQTIRNNIIVGTGGGTFDPAVCASDLGADAGADCSPSALTPTNNYLATSTFDGNVFWSSDGTSTSNQIGRGSLRFTCATLSSSGATVSGTCATADPQFSNVSTSFWNSPSSFNFKLLAASPAKSAGSTSASEVFDVNSVLRPSPPSLGALEGTGVPPITAVPAPAPFFAENVSGTAATSRRSTRRTQTDITAANYFSPTAANSESVGTGGLASTMSGICSTIGSVFGATHHGMSVLINSLRQARPLLLQ